MIKFAHKFLFIASMFFLSSAQAGLITSDLTEDNYVVIGELQWAWASPVNVEIWNNNTLYAPNIHTGWSYASDEQLNLLKAAIREDMLDNVFELFTRTNANGSFYVHAFEYWNSFYSYVDTTEDVEAEIVRSVWAENDPLVSVNNSLAYMLMEQADTFYVRPNVQGGGGSVSVPEPTTIMIFGFCLIALAVRQKFIL
ncbi:PEP-CTERM sorting domain-containing protein [Thalassotalea piscium]|uniref:Ice-binding protein C-terminal domain-containing protein n=1 Tax=Thalassotalea piscium TaxID=1230533 RepID=A0A7X0NJI1_9GAMM|nr:PEP-CTERM sorting domain-containing protein [Thalassotalea piscium]MBB6544602.1 hypothetical protein [Thalassotalea piscium]